MSNAFNDMRAAVQAAEYQLRAADEAALAMASMLRGRLRKVDSKYALSALKKELRDFDMTTGRWRDK
jgi:hypothetical protein